jgi:hypothetical protein
MPQPTIDPHEKLQRAAFAARIINPANRFDKRMSKQGRHDHNNDDQVHTAHITRVMQQWSMELPAETEESTEIPARSSVCVSVLIRTWFLKPGDTIWCMLDP